MQERKTKLGSTKKELPEALEKVNTNGKLDALIRSCRKGIFHCFESELVCPKMQLAYELQKYPECATIRMDVIEGRYDETSPFKNN
jgi:hypothetical protein